MGFLDWFKKKPVIADLREPQSHSAKAYPLHREFEGHHSRGLTPAKLAAIFLEAEQGYLTSQAELFLDMEEKDAHIAAELSKRKMAVKKLDWALEPPRGASATEKKNTQRLEELIRDELDIGAIRLAMLDAVGHSYSCQELGWTQNTQSLWIPGEIEHRPPSWFVSPQDNRNVLNLRDASYGVPLQPFGWIPHIHRSRSGYLARTGLHRVLAWPYLYKNYSVRDMAEFLEIYGLPIRVGKYPPSASDKEKRDLLRTVLSIGHNAAGIIPDSMALELQSAMSTGNADSFMAMINWCEASISKAILGGTLTSQTGTNGNRSLGDVHNEVRLDIRDDDAVQLDQSLSSFLVYPMAVLNGLFADNRCPRFVSDTQEPDDLAALADALPKLASAGARIPASYVNRKLKIPEPQEGEPILGATPQPQTTAIAPMSGILTSLSAAIPKPDITPGDSYADQLTRQAEPVLTDWLSSIKQLVESADSLETLQANLINHYGHLETDKLSNIMTLALTAADLAGRFDVKNESK